MKNYWEAEGIKENDMWKFWMITILGFSLFIYRSKATVSQKRKKKSLRQLTKGLDFSYKKKKGLDFISDKEICTRNKVYQPKL